MSQGFFRLFPNIWRAVKLGGKTSDKQERTHNLNVIIVTRWKWRWLLHQTYCLSFLYIEKCWFKCWLDNCVCLSGCWLVDFCLCPSEWSLGSLLTSRSTVCCHLTATPFTKSRVSQSASGNTALTSKYGFYRWPLQHHLHHLLIMITKVCCHFCLQFISSSSLLFIFFTAVSDVIEVYNSPTSSFVPVFAHLSVLQRALSQALSITSTSLLLLQGFDASGSDASAGSGGGA